MVVARNLILLFLYTTASIWAAGPNCKDVYIYLSRSSRLARLLSSYPGVPGFDTVEEHSRAVQAVYDDQKRFYPSGLIDDNLMRFTIALHDIGKPEAHRAGERGKQHAHTTPILADALVDAGFSTENTILAAALVGHDVLGDLVQGQSSVEEAHRKLKALAEIAHRPLKDFFALQTLFYVSDACSYDAIRHSENFKTVGGKIIIKNPAYAELAERIAGKRAPAAPVAFGDSDWPNYRAEPEIIKRYRKKWKSADKFTQYAFPRLCQKIFGNGPTNGITPEELSVILDYRLPGADQPHYEWVRAMWTQDPVLLERYDTEIRLLISALNKLPAFTGRTYRFVLLPPEALKRYVKGKTIVEPSVISSSRVSRNEDPFSFSNVFFEFELKGKAGHDIDFDDSAETEVLINAGTKFRVKDVIPFKKKVYSGTIAATKIILEEIPR